MRSEQFGFGPWHNCCSNRRLKSPMYCGVVVTSPLGAPNLRSHGRRSSRPNRIFDGDKLVVSWRADRYDIRNNGMTRSQSFLWSLTVFERCCSSILLKRSTMQSDCGYKGVVQVFRHQGGYTFLGRLWIRNFALDPNVVPLNPETTYPLLH